MKYVIGTALLGLLVGLSLHYIGEARVVGWSMIATLVVLPLIGILVTIDDDLPGGFSNPDGNTPGPWREWENWADLGARAAIAGIGFSIDRGIFTAVGIGFSLLGCAGIAGSIHIQGRIGRKARMTSNTSFERTREG